MEANLYIVRQLEMELAMELELFLVLVMIGAGTRTETKMFYSLVPLYRKKSSTLQNCSNFFSGTLYT